MLLLFSKSIYTVINWINILLFDLIKHDWEILCQIISDCDQKFLLSFWCVFFECLNTKFLIFTTYHPQVDNQSECMNQTVEIDLCYFFILHSNEVFITVLSYLQDYLNNNWNLSTNYAFNELAYRFCVNNILNALSLTDLLFKNYIHLHQIYCEEVKKAIAFINVISKFYYNTKHKSITVELMTYLWLHHDYIISDLMNRKLLN